MALWTGLGQTATVAQLVGADAGGLISMIIQAAVTAHQNKKECEQLARRVFMIAELLPHLQDPEVMRRPEVRRPLAGLGDTLREAHELVTSCQGRSAMYQFVTAGRQADRFRDVQSRIDSYLLVFPFISHIDITRRLDRIYNIVLPNDTSVPPADTQSQLEAAEVAQEVVPLPHGDGAEFAFAELAAATSYFAHDTKIGGGGFSRVYKGRLPDGREVAIKRMNTEEEFRNELAILYPLRHKHIVRLFGWSVQKEERLLVFEYMNNGTLYDHLHSQTSSSSPVTASWKMRIEILLGVSRAIEHLHNYAVPPVIHRDIKSSNVLLDASWVPCLSDFGPSVTYHEAEEEGLLMDYVYGTFGYLDPEYYYTSHLKPTSDVYNFGVMMLEVLTGKKAIDNWKEEGESEPGETRAGLVVFALPIIEAGELGKVLDRRPAPEPTQQQLEAAELVALTAARCLRLQGEDRPAMSHVVADLETALELVRCGE